MKDNLRAAKRRGEYFSLGTGTEGNNCFSICQNIENETGNKLLNVTLK